MKINFLKTNLKNLINQAERFTGKNLTLPILSHILFEVNDKKCSVKATNLEMALEASFPCKVIKDGVVTIPSRVFSTIIQNINEENITIEEKNNILYIQTENSKISINGSSDKDFPLIPKIKQPKNLTLSYFSLFSSLKSVLPSVSRSDLKPEISGVFFKIGGKRLKIASTDTFRLAEAEINVKDSDDKSFSFILPLKTAEEIIRFELTEDADVVINYNDNQIVFNIFESVITSRIIDGVFPEYSGIIPKNFETKIILDRNGLIQKIRSASVFSSKLNDIVFKYSDSELIIESSNNDLGSASFSLPIKQFSGKNGILNFNFRYILDGLESVEGEDIIINISGDNSPSLIKSTKNDSFLYVLMPIRNI